MQGLTMLLQNHYQRQRLYTRIALGKAGRMDVVWGETTGVKGISVFYCCCLLRTAVMEEVSEWQMVACGLLFIVMDVGNFVNTIATLALKFKFKAQMKRKVKVV